MSLETVSRLCQHLSLALSCVCLLLAEQLFIPEPELAIAPVLVLIVLAYQVEGRWIMADRAANLFGVLIALCSVWWMLYQFYKPTGPIILPLPVGLVPHLGPILMALLLVKLFRPRQPADFWVLQGLGLLQVTLACVLAADPRFGLVFVGYVASGLTGLALHNIAQPRIGNPERADASSPGAPPVPVGPFLRRSLLWTTLVGGVAIVLFLSTPRSNWAAWDPMTRFGIPGTSFRTHSGFTEEINLNHTGELELDPDTAFMVAAKDGEDQPKTDLPVGQRWRGAVLEVYHEGHWSPIKRDSMGGGSRRPRQETLPDFGPSQFYLTFQIQPRRAGGLVLAEPIRLGRANTFLPAISSVPTQPLPFYEFYGTVLPLTLRIPSMARKEYQYRQVTTPNAVTDRLPASNITDQYAQQLRMPPPWGIQVWTRDILRDLAAEGRSGLTQEDLDLDVIQENDTGEPIPRSAEKVARVLCAYLAESGNYTYSLDLQRQDLNVDPAVDFLCNVRAGHCERFASGLVLMLRGCGIPARVVKGFRGCEHQGDGVYLVRQRDAHSWVEALVPRPFSAHRIGDRREVYSCDWLMLDPTPQTDEVAVQSFSLWRWWQHQWKRSELLWHELVLGFNAEQQADLWYSLTSRREGGRTLLRLSIGFVSLLVLGWMGVLLVRRLPGWWTAWRRRSARRIAPAPPAWLTRLFALSGRYLGIRPNPGQTPRETALAATLALRRHVAASRFAELPIRVVEIYYRFRYGAHPLSDSESRSVEEDLTQLESAFQTGTA